MSSANNNRASLLAGLRTGGVRSASGPAIVPHTAAPGGSFNVPRYPPFPNQQAFEDDDDQLADMVNHSLHLNGNRRMMQQPVTASAADGVGNRFQQQQQAALLRQMAAQRAAMNSMPMGQMNGVPLDPQLQMQVVQMEIMKLQAIQAQQVQQYQADLLAQAQRQQQQQQRPLRRASGYTEPATAGPMNMTFDLRSRGMPTDAFGYEDGQVPMTAAIGGKFGSRTGQSALNPNAHVFTLRGDGGDEFETPKTSTPMSGRTTVISGGATLGSNIAPSKSDSALSWRRGSLGTPKSASTSPNVKISPPAAEDVNGNGVKARPQPLRFNGGITGSLGVAVEAAEPEEGDESDSSFTSGSANLQSRHGRSSSPTTPPSADSSDSVSTREEASKKLYEGLGMGRPAPLPAAPFVSLPPKQASQPIRQPRGPPASVDELGDRNFATRLPKFVVAEA